MDGIAGIIYPNVLQLNGLVHQMLDTLQHRGAAVQDTYTHKNIEIGICGDQLISDRQESVHIAIDGEIFNKKELKRKLKREGHPLEDPSLSQLLLAGYEVWGKDLFSHLNGCFSIAILDQKKKWLLLARDPIGKKPLYWYDNGNHFLFASELKAIMSTGVAPQTPALDALSSYLFFGFIPQDMSPIKNINKLLPAHYLQYHFDGSKSIHSYWSFSSYFNKQTKVKQGEVIEHLGELLEESTNARAPEGEKIGSLVSGGLGSASVAYYLSKIKEEKDLSCFTVAFEGETEDDITIAQEVAAKLNLPHDYESISQENFLDDFVKVVWHLDEPLSDPNIIATWRLAKLASIKTSTVFSGMGSDELLAGHSRYSIEEQKVSRFNQLYQPAIAFLRKALIPIANKVYKPAAFELMKKSRTDPWQFQFMSQNALLSKEEMRNVSPRLANIFDPEVFLHKFHHFNRIHSNVSALLYLDLKTRLPDFYALQYERLTSAYSLEWRTPYLDRNVIEYLVSLPEPDLLSEKETASYLKEMMDGILPDSIVNRPKRTRKYFLKDWIAHPDYRDIFNALADGALVESGLISKSWLKKQLNLLGKTDAAAQHLFAILTMEVWFRLFIIQPVSSSPPEISLRELLFD